MSDNYESTRIEFNITVKIGLGGVNLNKMGITSEDIASAFNMMFNEWADGRDNFNVESINHHLSEMTKWAVRHILYMKARAKYGNQMVETKPGSSTSKACIVTDEQMKQISYIAGKIKNDDDAED